MFAIIKTGGKQYIVKPGDKIKIEKRDNPLDQEIVFSEVLLINDNGKEALIGAPYLEEYRVKGKVLAQGRGKKVIVYKYKPKKRYHKKQGHRQNYTEVEILEIAKGGTKTAKTASTKKSSAVKKNSSAQKTKIQTAKKTKKTAQKSPEK